jgi:hypothetical protein
MNHDLILALLLLATGCGSTNGTNGSFGVKPVPSPGAKPATKKELPWLAVPGGRMQTTLFYGPWQCRESFMNLCRRECAQEGHPLMGCIWLADLKLEWEGSLLLLPVPVEAGSRYGLFHCCCKFPTRTKAENDAARQQWKNAMKSFRNDWSHRFGKWPIENGKAWPGHHIRDLWHGGDPVDPNNVFPTHPDVHDVYTEQYPACYEGKSPWNTVGPDLPYTDH